MVNCIVFKGEIFLGHTSSGYLVVPGFGPGFREMGFGFILHTPERAYQVYKVNEILPIFSCYFISFLLKLNVKDRSGLKL